MTPGPEQMMGKMEKETDILSSSPSSRNNKEAIHSGHFMVSEFEDVEVPDEDNVSVTVPVLEAEDTGQAVVAVAASQHAGFDLHVHDSSNTYTFGPRSCKSISIDATLTKLFQCMTIAYSGNKLTSPRWKNFKGLKLRWKDKIRLNNVIWRAWHMQFIKWQSPVGCQFACPLDGDTHNKPEAVVLEGKYWKRRLDTVCAEYKKWRLFYKEKLGRNNQSSLESDFDVDLFSWQPRSIQNFHSPSSMTIDDDLFSDFNDIIFSSLLPNQPFAFPNPREIARAGIADFIQPGLIQFQPNLDDFVDPLDLLSYRLPAVPEEPQSEDSSFQDLFNVPVSNTSSSNQGYDVSTHSNSDSVQFANNKSFTPPQTLSPFSLDNEFSLMDTGLIPTVLEAAAVAAAPPPPPPLPPPAVSGDKLSPSPLLTSLDTAPHPQLPIDPNSLDLQLSSVIQSVKPAMGAPQMVPPPPPPPQVEPSPAAMGVAFSQVQGKQQQQQRYNSQGGRNLRSKPSLATSQKYVSILPAPQNISSPTNQTNSTAVSIQSPVSTAASALLLPTTTQQIPVLSKIQTSSKQDVFIMPKGMLRTRARSFSGPQNTTASNSSAPALSPSTSTVVPQSALLAQLLTSGPYKSTEATPQSSSMSIISSVSSTSPPTVVLSPIQLGQTNSLTTTPVLSISSVDPSTFTATTSATSSSLPSTTDVIRAIPNKPFRPKSDSERVQYREHRRVCHINAEQKRRCNIKTGFDLLSTLVPSLNQNPPNKLSKAVVLQKAGEYIVQLRTERAQLQEEADLLRKQIESLNQSINVCQAQLPATGAPVSRQRISKLREMFDEYVRKRTLQNWKFWIFSILIQPLLETYNNSVSTASLTELSRTVLSWMEQHCSLVALRPGVLNSLRHLSTSTNILSDPTRIAEEATQAVSKSMPCGR